MHVTMAIILIHPYVVCVQKHFHPLFFFKPYDAICDCNNLVLLLFKLQGQRCTSSTLLVLVGSSGVGMMRGNIPFSSLSCSNEGGLNGEVVTLDTNLLKYTCCLLNNYQLNWDTLYVM